MDLGAHRVTNLIALIALAMVVIAFYADRKLDAFWPYTLTYETEGLQCEGDACNLKVWVKNGGWAAQRDVRFELPNLKKQHTHLYVSRGYKMINDLSRTTIDLGTLHPGSFRLVNVQYPKAIDSAFFGRDRLDIYSQDSEAAYGGPGEEAFILPRWYWYMMAGLVTLLAVQAVLRLFERPSGRYIRLLHDLDKALKQYKKSKVQVAKLRAQLDEIPDAAVRKAEAGIEKAPRWARPKSRRGVVENPREEVRI